MAHQPLPSLPTDPTYGFYWIQFDYTGRLCLRLISKEACYPPIFVNGHPMILSQRAAPSSQFPVTVWEAALFLNAAIINVDGIESFIPSTFDKIAFIGDTGCRPTQECLEDKWPFEKILCKIANEDTNLIIHLGDYVYRHLAAQRKCCPGDLDFNEGDNWLGWLKEFFIPGRDILSKVLWVFVRGNQEDCQCASEGWRRFLDPYPYNSKCLDYTEPFAIKLNKVTLIVHDSSFKYPEDKSTWPEEQLNDIVVNTTNPIWLLTHRPLWGVVNDQKHNDDKPLIMLNEHGNTQTYLEPLPSNVTTIFSGHIHAFQIIKLAAYPIHHFVIGNGGVALEADQPPEILKNAIIDDQKIKVALSLIMFGYGLAEYKDKEWKLTLKDTQGTEVECFSCAPPP